MTLWQRLYIVDKDGADFITDDDDEGSTAIKRTARNAQRFLPDAATQKAAVREFIGLFSLSLHFLPSRERLYNGGPTLKKCQRKFQHLRERERKRERTAPGVKHQAESLKRHLELLRRLLPSEDQRIDCHPIHSDCFPLSSSGHFTAAGLPRSLGL